MTKVEMARTAQTMLTEAVQTLVNGAFFANTVKNPVAAEMLIAKLNNIDLVINARLSVRVGQAIMHKNRIELNYNILKVHQYRMPITIGHELAHLVAWHVFAADDHGAKWAQIMNALDLPAEEFCTLHAVA